MRKKTKKVYILKSRIDPDEEIVEGYFSTVKKLKKYQQELIDEFGGRKTEIRKLMRIERAKLR